MNKPKNRKKGFHQNTRRTSFPKVETFKEPTCLKEYLQGLCTCFYPVIFFIIFFFFAEKKLAFSHVQPCGPLSDFAAVEQCL